MGGEYGEGFWLFHPEISRIGPKDDVIYWKVRTAKSKQFMFFLKQMGIMDTFDKHFDYQLMDATYELSRITENEYHTLHNAMGLGPTYRFDEIDSYGIYFFNVISNTAE